jgi:competence protein ComGC
MMNEKGFTLIEMLIVLLIISILLLITIPNIGKHESTIQDKGCQALQKMVQSQVESYKLDKDSNPPTLEDLKKDGYITTYTCQNKKELGYDKTTGTVTLP